MYPILFQNSFVVIPAWHVFFSMAATAAFVAIAQRNRLFFKIEPFHLKLTLFALYCSSYAGARILSEVILQPDFYLKNILYESLFLGPMTLLGGVVFSLFVLIFIPLKNKFDILNLIAPAFLLGVAIGRIGCFLNGDDFGFVFKLSYLKYNLFLGFDGEYRFPVQLVESFGCFVGYFIFKGSKFFVNQSAFLGVTLFYSVLRFILEFYRDDSRGWVGPFSTSQFICLGILGFIFFGFCFSKYLERTLRSKEKHLKEQRK